MLPHILVIVKACYIRVRLYISFSSLSQSKSLSLCLYSCLCPVRPDSSYCQGFATLRKIQQLNNSFLVIAQLDCNFEPAIVITAKTVFFLFFVLFFHFCPALNCCLFIWFWAVVHFVQQQQLPQGLSET